MHIEEVRTIAVVGAGNMGHQIATLCAIQGFRTWCTDLSADALARAEAFVEQYLPGRVAKQKMSLEAARQARENLRFTPQLAEAVGEADYIIEAAVEVLEVKRGIFTALDRLAPTHAVLATNSSAIVSSRIADATRRPEKVVNLHFFNPALVMKLVEVVQGPHVADDTAQVSMDLCTRLGKTPVRVRKEVEGFLLNRIFFAIFHEAEWLLETGVATAEDIDKACVFGAGHPMGPFRLMDLTGIDLAYTLAMEKFRQTGRREDLPPPSLVEHYVKGEFGRKTGKGWYDYGD
jgi:3-hydroxybutyryl-CoA dehydrogenase